jgi:dynein intermediate chain 2
MSKIEESHREAVSSISWIKTKHHNEFVTTSTDRDVIFWTVVNFDKIGHPVTKDSPPIIITREAPCGLIDKESEKEYGGNVIEYNSESGPAKLLVGTEQGTVFTINKKKDEGGEVSQTKFGFKWGRHLGPIVAMQRCPDSLKYFLTVGDWTARVYYI